MNYLKLADNSYKSADGKILIGVPHRTVAEDWARSVDTKPEYLVLFGSENDRECAKALLALYPDCRIIGGAEAIYKLTGFAGREFKSIVIRGERELTLGGTKLRFSCPGRAANMTVTDAESGETFGNALPERMVPGEKTVPTAAIFCAPGGYTWELAEKLSEGIKEAGNIDVRLIDLDLTDRETAVREAKGAELLLFGSEYRDGWAAKEINGLVTTLKKSDCAGKPAACFLNMPPAERGENSLRLLLGLLGFDLNTADIVLSGKPDTAMLQYAAEAGYALGCRLLKIPNKRKPMMMKCLVCGEIFDASLGICPVCGAGLEQCAPVDEDAVSFHCDTQRRYLILGGGTAAVSAAEAIRLRDGTGKITLLSAEDCLPINRPLLSKDEPVGAEGLSLTLHDADWYKERNIEIKLNTVVNAIDTKNKTVTAGEVYTYDRLIYALGAECFVPPFPGREKDGVVTLRHRNDLDGLWKRMESAKNAVVIGGGAIGLEAGSKMMRCGIRVTVLEAAEQIMERQIDRLSADCIKASIASFGCECLEGVSVAEILGDERVTGVRLNDGREFPADIVLISCGVRPSTELAKAAGIPVGRGVTVDRHMKTGTEDVYACGDCAEFEGVNFQLWSEASMQGRVAGANAAGDEVSYTTPLLGMGQSFFGTSFFAIGDPGKKPGVKYKTVTKIDEVTGKRETYWFAGNRLEGAVLLRSPEKTADTAVAVTAHARYEELFRKGKGNE